MYVLELMTIETNARKRVVDAIAIEKKLAAFEQQERNKGKVVLNCDSYNDLRHQLIDIICQMNAVANSEGKGRDDLSIEILLAAENISRRVSCSQSRAVRKLAEAIKKAFADIRQLLRKFDESLESVDPQLKNNANLVELLVAFEKSWEKGKEFLLNANVSGMLIHFSRLVEVAAEKHKELREKIETADTEVFVIIPCLVVLSSLDGDGKSICQTYYPSLKQPGSEQSHYDQTKQTYDAMQTRSRDKYGLYNLVELSIMDKDITEKQLLPHKLAKGQIAELVHNIKLIAMGLQRHNPAEWNSLMETAMGQI
jgi:hypothetical protein